LQLAANINLLMIYLRKTYWVETLLFIQNPKRTDN